MTDLADNLANINNRIAAATAAAGRTDAVQLVAVSKMQSADAVQTLLAAGQRRFGENRVQEAAAKFAGLRVEYPDMQLRLIGPLQTNKALAAVALFDVIEVLDRPVLADALSKAMRRLNRSIPCLIEVNIGAEPQKTGLAPADLGDFLRYSRATCGLTIEGLMCIPPQGDDPVPHFNRLRELVVTHGLRQLSMGMSADFEAAIVCGATSVRVGSALFGPRATAAAP